MIVLVAIQRRPTWPYRPVTLTWQQQVVEELSERKMTRRALAKKIRCSPGAITGALKAGQRTSRLVIPISEALGIPTSEFEDEIDRDAVGGLRRLRHLDRDYYDEVVARIRRRVRTIDGGET
jgi:hypothetical protein